MSESRVESSGSIQLFVKRLGAGYFAEMPSCPGVYGVGGTWERAADEAIEVWKEWGEVS